MRGTNLHRRARIYERVKDKLPDLISYSFEDYDIFNVLNPSQAAELVSMKITSISDFYQLMMRAKSDQHEEIYNVSKDSLPEMISTGEDFKQAFEYLSAEQSAELGSKVIKNELGRNLAIKHIKGENYLHAVKSYRQQSYKTGKYKSSATVYAACFFQPNKISHENVSDILERYRVQLMMLDHYLTSNISDENEEALISYRIAKYIKVAIKEFASCLNQNNLYEDLETVTKTLMSSEYKLEVSQRSDFMDIIEQTAKITKEMSEEITAYQQSNK